MRVLSVQIQCFLVLIVLFTLINCYFITAATATSLKHSADENDNNSDDDAAAERQEFAENNLALEFKEIIDTETDPCDDFYEHVCGKYPQKYPMDEKDTNVAVTSFTRIDRKIRQRILNIVQRQYSFINEPMYNFMHEIFESCTQTDELDKQSLPYLKKISKWIKNWPLSNSSTIDYNWMKLNFLIRKWEGVFNTIAPIGLAVDPDDNSKYVLALDINREEIEKKNLKNPLHYIAYEQLVKRTMSSFLRKGYVKHAMEIVKFERKIHLILSKNNTKLFRTNILEISKKKLKMFEPYGFKNYVRYLLGNLNRKTILRLKINEKSAFIIEYGNYFTKMDKLLNKTPERVIKNYIIWKFLEPKLAFLNSKLRKALNVYWKAVSEDYQEQKRSDECVDYTYQIVPYIINNIYIKKYSTTKSIATVTKMVKNIHSEVREMTLNSTWIDRHIINETIGYMDTIKTIVSHPKEILDQDLLLSKYEILMSIWNKNELLESIMKFNLIKFEQLLINYNKPVDTTNDWNHFDVKISRAYYFPSENHILIAIGIMQPPIFDADLPAAFNYGSLGAIIGHELFHGYSKLIENIETNGKLIKYVKIVENYVKRRNQVQRQYSQFVDPVTKLHVNGEQTLDENISDINGLVAAYRAFKRRNNTNSSLDNFAYTDNQLFWLSFARLWCTNETPEHTKMRLLNDNHAPKRFRVNGALQNNPDFSSDFNCAKGSPMNPKIKHLFF